MTINGFDMPAWGEIVAIIALAQPWAYGAWKKWIRSPEVAIYPTGDIEVGFSQFGPTIGLHGSLQGSQEDVFVQSIDLELVRVRDQATHNFEWQYFRAHRGRLSEMNDPEVELAAGFMLMVDHPHRYSIVFTDTEVQEEIRSALERLQGQWWEYVRERLGTVVGEDVTAALEAYNQHKQQLYNQFSQSADHVDIFGQIDRARYWDSGEYALTMTVETADPDRSFERRWLFELSESQADSLGLNVTRMMRGACDQQLLGNFMFAYCGYEQAAS